MQPQCDTRNITNCYLPCSDSVNTRNAEPDAECVEVTTLDLETATTVCTKPSQSDTCERPEHDSTLSTRTTFVFISAFFGWYNQWMKNVLALCVAFTYLTSLISNWPRVTQISPAASATGKILITICTENKH